ncbi:hypothetical protein ACFLWG_04905 [Chloroflexota bacterium]
MRNKIKDVTEERAAGEDCHHYWIIESASGPISRGRCRSCGAEKEFSNSLPDYVVVKRHTRVLELPKLPDVELDGESNS